MTFSIVIAGVGGQGTLLTGKIIGNMAIEQGYDVKVSETHGMAQRGGSVLTYVRYSKGHVHSPVIEEGGSDIVLAFELLEAYRAAGYLKPGGLLIANTQKISPMPVISGAARYPEDIEHKLSAGGHNAVCLDALKLAHKAGDARCVNTVLLGVMASFSPNVSKENWYKALELSIKPKLWPVNKLAFDLGFNYNTGVNS